MPLRVLVADDHAIVRAGVRSVLEAEPGFTIISEHSNGNDALEAIRSEVPDIALLDIEMGGLTGIEIARKLNEANSLTAVVVLSMHLDESFVCSAVEAGISGYVVKQDAGRELIEAMHAAARGDVFISPRVAGSLIDRVRRPQRDAPLAPRERDVVRLLSRGMTSKEIASELGLTTKTVDGYRAAIMTKLNIHSVAGLVKYALRQHLTTVED